MSGLGIANALSVGKEDTGTKSVAVTMAWALIFGILAVFVSLWGSGTIWRGLLWSAAWSSVGWFLGFLFGIPRFLSSDTARTPASSDADGAHQDAAAAKAEADTKRQAADKAEAASQSAADTLGKLQSAVPALDPAGPALVKAQAALEQARQVAKSAQTESDQATALAQSKAADAAKARASSAGSSATSLSVNTNLEQISDWLTKIIVGVSLVESQALLGRMHDAARFMAQSMGGGADAWAEAVRTAAAQASASAASDAAAGASAAMGLAAASAASAGQPVAALAHDSAAFAFASAESLAFALMLYFLASGLLGSYLLTRLYLQGKFAQAAEN